MEQGNLPGQPAGANPAEAVVVEQPKANDDINPDGHVGTEELEKTDRVLVQQLGEYSEQGNKCCCCCNNYEGENEFEITDRFGHQIFHAKEESGFCGRQCCNSLRGFEMFLSDRQGKDCIKISRPTRFDNCLICPCLLQSMVVESPIGVVVGKVEQKLTLFSPEYEVLDADDTPVFNIEGPSTCKCCSCGCCCGGSRNIVFKIISKTNNEQVGSISKSWNGVLKDVLPKADRFSVDFPPDIDIGMKASLLAATFLIDYLHFEADPGDENQDDNDYGNN
ncbi:phospholipid scramblase 3 [Eurytemora carolleeae]|uniref:phospholipid scramblase 3 n=1 Tax=Eurytemora carolleeae TaxID=1294199 RepID=UPI000C7759BE|nr:phospholipid scramblase 3 [Eurytemora carolleeae]|eukprot:XP_023336636.1 phospholipid scramblase 3-like [Eurytemora affinis]